jgi:hypothetical protein
MQPSRLRPSFDFAPSEAEAKQLLAGQNIVLLSSQAPGRARSLLPSAIP